MENKDKKTFSYTYSAKEQEEIKKIRERYVHHKKRNLTKWSSFADLMQVSPKKELWLH